MAWNRKNLSRDVFLGENDIRKILAITAPGECLMNEETGELNNSAFLTIAGPKGGSFRMFLPEWFWNQYAANIAVGDGIANGGWVAGKFIIPDFYEAA